ncbi:plasmid stabilization system protein [Desulfocapsa sulfexigens DSM 10523]|uniref:Plasmid stabilization system protein n=1 Tax=Desulfocapsa sulfexigens (strain DSM 10523 / SB164P1) TaxID=1167006 RepID=M1PGJ6_DESSD|nr:type II toxin-antitoxin system RelE/ParE family toxin [Desulfocapsa sulfexigens]AGF78770.1 plasmid stabilization system protein [Desulfocapsa sulfexigens DSM 10523]
MKITWSPLAIDRASEIAEYISLDNPTAASKWIDDIFEKVLILNSMPKMGRTVPEINRKEIRGIIFGNYRIIYRIEEMSIAILTIRHTKQILPVDELIA